MAKTKHKAVAQGASLTADLHNIDKIYKSELKSTKADGCINGCFSFFTTTKIPQNYKNVLAWLVSIGEAEAQNEQSGSSIDTTVITTALKLGLEYAASTKVGGSIASATLNAVVDGLVAAFDLNLNDVINIEDLSKYCQTNSIEIPAEIQPYLLPMSESAILKAS